MSYMDVDLTNDTDLYHAIVQAIIEGSIYKHS